MNKDIPAFFQNIRQQISDGDLPEAIRLLRSLLDNSPRLDEALHQSGRLSDLQRQIRTGTVSHENATLTKNQIQMGVLEMLTEIEAQQTASAQVRQEVEQAVSIVNSKNVVTGSNITAGGNVTIGDTTTLTESQTSRRLRLFLYFFVPLLAIGAAVLWYRLQEMRRPLTLKVRVENRTPNPELPEPTGTLSLTYGSKTDPKTNVAAEAFFEGIPANFKNETVRLRYEAKGFVPVDTTFLLASDAMVLPVRRNDDLASITGFLTDEAGKRLEDVKVSLPCCFTLTDETGKFVLRIPFGQQRTRQRLDFFKEGFAPKSVTTPIISGEAVRLILASQVRQ